MGKLIKKISIVCICILVIGISPISFINNGTDNINASDSAPNQEIQLGCGKVIFASIIQGTNILSANDEYFNKFSKFDYASKFKSLKPLSLGDREKFYSKVVIDWSSTEKKVVGDDIKIINSKIKEMNLNLPKEIVLIRTNGDEEAGAAYTRENAIILPVQMGLTKELITHELFHVFSRYNKDLAGKLYGVLNFKKCKELKFPKELKDLTIANPDSIYNNYYITAFYNGKQYNFIPIIYLSEPYDIKSNKLFFYTLKDDMLAVKIINAEPVPIYENGKLLIVKKNEIDDFNEKIGYNTDYTYSPEEIAADNFVILVFGEAAASKWVIDGFENVLK